MKEKKIKKLILSKTLIANLNPNMMKNVIGKGETETACGSCYCTLSDCCVTIPETLCDCPDTDVTIFTCGFMNTCNVCF